MPTFWLVAENTADDGPRVLASEGATGSYLAFVTAVLLMTAAIDWLHRSIYTFVILGAALIALS